MHYRAGAPGRTGAAENRADCEGWRPQSAQFLGSSSVAGPACWVLGRFGGMARAWSAAAVIHCGRAGPYSPAGWMKIMFFIGLPVKSISRTWSRSHEVPGQTLGIDSAA